MRLGLKTLKKIEDWYGSDNFEIGSGGNVKDGRGDYKFAETYLTLRFGYWNEINMEELSKVIGKKVELEMKIYDDNCGCKYYYKVP
tara:strand:+ start:639 stop:896 length:258 start_codon:yes stop_codon:yes gene_type:complete